MSVLTAPATFDVVDAGVGEQVKARRTALGMTVKGLAERAGIDRGRLAALEAGDPTIRQTTVGAVERALSLLEHELGIDHPTGDEIADVVEFRVAGNFGVDVVVKGPVRDLQALEDSVARLVERMQARERNKQQEG